MTASAQTFTIHDFQAKWRGATLKERSASQSHFNDLSCAIAERPVSSFGEMPRVIGTFVSSTPWTRSATMDT